MKIFRRLAEQNTYDEIERRATLSRRQQQQQQRQQQQQQQQQQQPMCQQSSEGVTGERRGHDFEIN